jgi:hypothetical protein
MRRIGFVVSGILVACRVLAQDTNRVALDYGLAAEVLKLDPSQVAAAVDQSQQASATYQNAAMAQHLAQLALQRGLTARYDVSRALHEAEQRVLIMALRGDVVRDVAAPTDSETKAFYEKNVTRWQYPDQFQADAIRVSNAVPTMVSALVTALAATNWLEKVQGIASNAVVMATAQSGAWFGTNQVDQVIWQALTEMKHGAVKDVKVGDQVVVVHRADFRKAGKVPFDKAKNEAAAMLRQEREEKAWQDFINGEKSKAGI